MDGRSLPRRIPLKSRRLHSPSMYKQVFEAGKALRASPLTLRWFRAGEDISRIGYIIRKKTGNAPFRNAIRRTLRRTFQEALPSLAEGTWFVFDVSDKASAMTRGRLKEEAGKLLQAASSAAAKVAASGVGRT